MLIVWHADALKEAEASVKFYRQKQPDLESAF